MASRLSVRSLPEPSETFWVSLRYFSLTRLVIAAVLAGAVLVFGNATEFGASDAPLFVRTAIVYAVLGAVLAYLPAARPRGFYYQLGAQLLLDVVALTIMLHASEGTRGAIAVLFLLPIAGAALLSPPLLAAFFAAICALAILGETLLRNLDLEVASTSTLQAGLYGIAYFILSVIMNRLAARVIAQESIARRRFDDLQAQIEINRLVVADMQDGVLIMSGDGYPRSLNPAAARMLHVRDVQALSGDAWAAHPMAQVVSKRFAAWREQGDAAATFECVISGDERGEAFYASDRLRVRFVAAELDGGATGDFVVFLEDMQRVDELAQQLKLASMGRLTASIAHEIRNPLAAISHATALLNEDLRGVSENRLLNIVQENTRRLDRIVQNILQLSRRAPVAVGEVKVRQLIEDVVEEFCRDQNVSHEVVEVSLYGDPVLSFNEDHLRQVLVNLLQNAYRFASKKPGSIDLVVVPILPQITVSEDGSGIVHKASERMELIVHDDGVGINVETRRHLFEPFFTTHYEGTGLGLYLARELCLANGATLGYVPNADENKKGGFVVNAEGWLA